MAEYDEFRSSFKGSCVSNCVIFGGGGSGWWWWWGCFLSPTLNPTCKLDVTALGFGVCVSVCLNGKTCPRPPPPTWTICTLRGHPTQQRRFSETAPAAKLPRFFANKQKKNLWVCFYVRIVEPSVTPSGPFCDLKSARRRRCCQFDELWLQLPTAHLGTF